jgi:hypothetical protein
MTQTQRTLTHSESQAAAQMDSIREMVAALECNYERLEDLREERDNYDPAAESGTGWTENDDTATWATRHAGDAAELNELEKAAGDCADRDHAETRIHEDPLSVLVRDDWRSPGEPEEGATPAEYEILLCTGGPACRIRGQLDGNCEPETATMQHQDWGTPWTDWPLSREDEETLLTYARCFCYGY